MVQLNKTSRGPGKRGGRERRNRGSGWHHLPAVSPGLTFALALRYGRRVEPLSSSWCSSRVDCEEPGCLARNSSAPRGRTSPSDKICKRRPRWALPASKKAARERAACAGPASGSPAAEAPSASIPVGSGRSPKRPARRTSGPETPSFAEARCPRCDHPARHEQRG